MTAETVDAHSGCDRNDIRLDSLDIGSLPAPDDSNAYPEGGTRAWLCATGCCLGLLGSIGLLNSVGAFQAYLSEHQLSSYSSGKIGWIFSLMTFLTFLGGVQIGPIFDARGPRLMMLIGSALIVGAIVSLGSCTAYWQFMLALGVAVGLGTSLVFTPCFAAVGHFFHRRRGLATGIAAAGGSIGGVLWPLLLPALYPRIGWAWTTRVVALISFVCLAVACLLVTSRLPRKPLSREHILPDFLILRDPAFLFTTLSIFFVEWGFFVPISYVSLYALDHGIATHTSYQLLAILNATSLFGRLLPGYFADRVGRFNVLIIAVAMCLLSNACLWLPAGNSVGMLIAFASVYGFSSGSNISLTPVCVGQLCDTKHYGRYYATAYTIVSFGIPIAGEILSRCNGQYWGLIVFAILCYAAGLVCAVVAKVLACGWEKALAVF